MALHPLLPAPPPLPDLLARGHTALFLDFDGTLVAIADGPDAIAVPGGLAGGLQRLAARLDGALALVSGRSISNLHQFLGPLPLHIAGSHGGHVLDAQGEVLSGGRPLPDQAIEEMAAFAADLGLLLERKAHGAALHYRAVPELKEAAHDFAQGIAQQYGLARKSGKCVIELVWPGADKGGAVELLAARVPFSGALPVFIGDDVTDEDGFAACQRLGGFGIAVGERRSAAARYSLESVKDVHAWLEL